MFAANRDWDNESEPTGDAILSVLDPNFNQMRLGSPIVLVCLDLRFLALRLDELTHVQSETSETVF